MQEKKLTMTVEEAGQLLGISRNTAYLAVRDGTIPTIRLARRLVVPRSALMRCWRTRGRSRASPRPPKNGSARLGGGRGSDNDQALSALSSSPIRARTQQICVCAECLVRSLAARGVSSKPGGMGLAKRSSAASSWIWSTRSSGDGGGAPDDAGRLGADPEGEARGRGLDGPLPGP